MALSGMTGFARVTGEESWGAWAWEAKSVNGRSLDVRVNYPPGFDPLEREVKAMATDRPGRISDASAGPTRCRRRREVRRKAIHAAR